MVWIMNSLQLKLGLIFICSLLKQFWKELWERACGSQLNFAVKKVHLCLNMAKTPKRWRCRAWDINMPFCRKIVLDSTHFYASVEWSMGLYSVPICLFVNLNILEFFDIFVCVKFPLLNMKSEILPKVMVTF